MAARLRAIYSGESAKPLIEAQERIYAAELHADEFHREEARQCASKNAKSVLSGMFQEATPLERRRMMQQTYKATLSGRQHMRKELRRRFSLGKNTCQTCNLPKRGVPRKTWVRAPHLKHGEKILRQKEPGRFRYCDCKERIEELWHDPKISSRCMACQSVKLSSLVPLLNCGHRVLCELCKMRHAFCPLCHRRYNEEANIEKTRPVQLAYANKTAAANKRCTIMQHAFDSSTKMIKMSAGFDFDLLVEPNLPIEVKRSLFPRPTTASRERHMLRTQRRLI